MRVHANMVDERTAFEPPKEARLCEKKEQSAVMSNLYAHGSYAFSTAPPGCNFHGKYCQMGNFAATKSRAP